MRNITIPHSKYLHILWHNALYFNQQFVNMINKEDKYFNTHEHIFITPYVEIFEKLKEYSNVYLVPQGNLIRKYGKYADWIFVHSLNCNKVSLIFLPKEFAKKVIWRTWGHDVWEHRSITAGYHPQIIKSLFREFLVQLWQNKVSQFYGIAVANDVDSVRIRKIWKNCRILPLPYDYVPGQLEKIELIMKERSSTHSNEIQVMIGHSSSSGDRHIEVLDMIKKYSTENICVHLFLYGSSYTDYGRSVITKANEIFGINKVVLHESFIPYEDFIRVLNNIDVAIIATRTSAALGTLRLLAFMGKKIIIDPHGDIAEAVRYDGGKAYTLEQIAKDDFNNFAKNDQVISEDMKRILGNIPSSENACTEFQNILKDFQNGDGEKLYD